MQYDILLWRDEGIWTAHAPSVPGAYGIGRTPKAAKADLAGALRELATYLKSRNRKLPRPFAARCDRVAI